MDKESERIAMEQVVKELDTEIASTFAVQLAELRGKLEDEKQEIDFHKAILDRLDEIIGLLNKIATNTWCPPEF